MRSAAEVVDAALPLGLGGYTPTARSRLRSIRSRAGWLQYELEREGKGTRIRQTAVLDAKGLAGRAYWYLILPFHHLVFEGTLKGIDRECRALAEGPNTCPLPDTTEGRTTEDSRAR